MTTLQPTTLSSPWLSAPVASQPRFGNSFSQAVEGSATNRAGRFLKALDFQELGTSNLNQIKVVYGLCILSRLYNAAKRSKNEVREVLTRDSLGFAFWFFATPILQRLFLAKCVPAQYRSALIQQAPPATRAQNWSELQKLPTLKEKLRFINGRLNPLARWTIPSSHQVKDQMAQALSTLERAGHKPGSDAFLKLENYYKQLVKYRNLSTGVGWAMTIGLLGIGINMYNIYLTKKKVAQGQVGR